MKNKLLSCIVICLITLCSKAQDAGVEYLTGGVQVGFAGAWVTLETGLDNQLVFRAEAGIDAGYIGGNFTEYNGNTYTTVITVEPRYYYNFLKRDAAGKNTTKNSANFISVRLNYHTDVVTITDRDKSRIPEDISIIPTWGIRRHIGSYLNYELGIGAGYQRGFIKLENYSRNTSDFVVNLHLRIGFSL